MDTLSNIFFPIGYISDIWVELFELNLFCIQVNNYYPVII